MCIRDSLLYNTQRDEWFHIPTFGCSRTLSPNLVSYQSNLYLIGGKYSTTANENKDEASTAQDDYSVMKHIQNDGKLFQHFDPRIGKWSQLPQMTYARYRSAVGILNDTLYVSGGDDLVYYKGFIECYNFKACKWDIFETTMPKPKMNHTLIPHHNQLWFFGGQNYDSDVIVNDLSWYAYDLAEHSWFGVSKADFRMPASYGKFTTKAILDVVVSQF